MLARRGDITTFRSSCQKNMGILPQRFHPEIENARFSNDDIYKRIPRVGMGSFIYKGNKRIPSKLKKHLILFLQC